MIKHGKPFLDNSSLKFYYLFIKYIRYYYVVIWFVYIKTIFLIVTTTKNLSMCIIGLWNDEKDIFIMMKVILFNF